MPAIYSTIPLNVVTALDMGKRSRGAAMGLLFYDHMMTLDLEVELIWMQKKTNPAFWLYIFNRFFALAYLIFDSVPLTKSGVVNSRVCVIYLMCDDIVTLLTTLSVQVILQLRVYALYKRSRKVLIFLMTIFAFEISTMVVLIGITMKHLENIPLISTSTGCYYKGLLQLSAVFWAPGLVYEPILFGMIAYKAWGRKILNEPRIPLVTKMARDSLLYFI
ncbi:hypothetical protein C8Q75DRAFT_878851, partial [Abortiporus biennis]